MLDCWDKSISYFFTDQEPVSGVNYYRLNQFDVNGMNEQFSVETVNFSGINLEGTIYPNPFSNSLNISINESLLTNETKIVQLKIYNILGEIRINSILTKQLTAIETSDLSPGIYFYQILKNDKINLSGRLVSQK